MKTVVVVSAVRTPVGRKGGCLRTLKKPELAGLAMRGALERAGMTGAEVDDVIYGGIGSIEFRGPARHFWLEAGLPVGTPGMTINRACSTSLTGVALAAAQIKAGFGDTYLVGGMEMDSRTSYVLVNDAPYKAGMPVVSRGYFSPEAFGNESMPRTAENLAEKYGITREQCDAYALRSHQLAWKGYEEGLYQEHMIPVKIPGKGGKTVVDRDETLRHTTAEQLAALKPVMDGVVTAGNSSPLNDGASAAVVMLEEKARAMGLKPLLRFVDYTAVGVDPRIMGIGPVPAMRKLLERNGMKPDNLTFLECNEAFAVQTLAVVEELRVDFSKLNVRGGAIALGHPGAATGVSLVAKSASLMRRMKGGRCAITFCNGGGMGVAALFESCDG